MKKNFIKKLAFVMASALVVTGAAPAAQAGAALKDVKLNKTSKNLYLNADNPTGTSNKFNFDYKNLGKKADYTVKWSVEDSSVVKLAKGGVVTAKKVGTTSVYCKITKKSTGKSVTLEATVNVKANAASVAITNVPENNTMAVGTSHDFNRTMKSVDGKKATDKTAWVIDEETNTAGATVDKKGIVTVTKAGEFTLTAQTYQSEATKDQITAKSEPVTIKVPVELKEVTLKTPDTIDLEFNSSVKDIIKSKSDIKIETVATNKIVLPVKDFSVSEDGKTVTVTSYQEFVNGTTYKVEAAESKKELVAQIGTIASIVIENQVVAPINDLSKASDLKYTVKDEFGVDLTSKYPIGGLMTLVSSSTSGSYVSANGKIAMFTVGDVISVQLKYIKYNTTTGADESVTSNVATITCVQSTTNATSGWSIYDDNNSAKAFDKVVTTVNAGDNSKTLYVKVKDNYGKETINTGLAFESLNPSVLVIDRNTGKLYPIASGSAVVKVTAGAYVEYITINVNPSASLVSVKPETTNYTLSNSDKLGVVDNKDYKFTLIDNYNETFKGNGEATLTVLSGTDAVTVNGAVLKNTNDSIKFNFVNGEATIKIAAVPGKTGAATLRVDYQGKTTVVSVSSVAPAGAVDYKLELTSGKLDSFKSESTNLTIYSVDNAGVKAAKINTVSGTTITYQVKDSSGVVKASGNFDTVATINSTGLASGTYTVYVYVGPIVKTVQFEIVSSKLGSEVVVNKNSVTNVVSGSAIETEITKALEFKVNGNKVTQSNVEMTYQVLNTAAVDATGKNVSWANESILSVLVKEVKFTADGVVYTVAVNTVITLYK